MEDVKEKQKSMHEPTMIFAWIALAIGVIILMVTEIDNTFSAPIISLAVILFMFSKLIGVLEQIRDK